MEVFLVKSSMSTILINLAILGYESYNSADIAVSLSCSVAKTWIDYVVSTNYPYQTKVVLEDGLPPCLHFKITKYFDFALLVFVCFSLPISCLILLFCSLDPGN